MMRARVLGLVLAVCAAACGDSAKSLSPAEQRAELDRLAGVLGVEFPDGTELVGTETQQGRDTLVQVKVAMSAAAFERFSASCPVKVEDMQPGPRGLLGPNHEFWDPRAAPSLRTGQAALPDAKYLNVAVDDRDANRIVVYLEHHGT